jgi:hypothetical protein
MEVTVTAVMMVLRLDSVESPALILLNVAYKRSNSNTGNQLKWQLIPDPN